MDVHESMGHLGQEYVLTNLRQKYWIMQGRAAVWRVLGNCLTCWKQNAEKGQQVMADLPSDRLSPDEHLFSYVAKISLVRCTWSKAEVLWNIMDVCSHA